MFAHKVRGPLSVLKEGLQDYVIATPNRRKSSQLCHVNLLKPYYSPSPRTEESGDGIGSAALAVGEAVSSPQSVAAEGENEAAPDDCLLLPRLRNSEMLKNLDGLLGHMLTEQRGDLKSPISSYSSLFSDIRTCTNVMSHGKF